MLRFIKRVDWILLIQILEDTALRGKLLFLMLIMKVIIFNDKNNFEGSLNIINNTYGKGNRRFWDFDKCIQFMFQKLKGLEGFKDKELELVKIYLYTGKYNSEVVSNFSWQCMQKVKELREMVKKEESLLKDLERQNIDSAILSKIKSHVKSVKETFEKKINEYLGKIDKQKRNFSGQKIFFEKLDKNPLIELRTTPLKQADGEIYQKGVDGKIVTDLVNLAHMRAYDVALLLGGDTDIIEAIKLVRQNLSKTVVVVACYNHGESGQTNISDVKDKCDFFINLHECKKELFDMSEPLRKKEDK